MPHDHKPKLKPKAKKPSHIPTRRIITWALAGLLLIAIATITTKIAIHQAQITKLQNTQLTTLNAAATDLKPIYDQLVATMPNIRSKDFEKSCGKSSDVLNNGTITCGTSIGVLSDTYSPMNLPQDIQAARQLMLKSKAFQLVSEGKIGRSTLYGSTSYYAHYKYASGLECYLDQEVFDDSTYFNKAHNSDLVYDGAIYIIDIGCNKSVKNFLPGYQIR